MTNIGTNTTDMKPAREPMPQQDAQAQPSSTDSIPEGVSARLRDRFLLGR